MQGQDPSLLVLIVRSQVLVSLLRSVLDMLVDECIVWALHFIVVVLFCRFAFYLSDSLFGVSFVLSSSVACLLVRRMREHIRVCCIWNISEDGNVLSGGGL